MKKFEGILFCTDLDGTLFADDKSLSAENKDAIDYFKAEGGLFTFITGRVPKTSADICRIAQPNAPYGCLNGGGIYDPVRGEYIWRRFLTKEAWELVRAVDKNLPGMGIQFNTEKELYFCRDNSAMEHFRAVTGVPNTRCDYETLTDPVLKVVFAHLDETQILALIDLLARHPKAELFDFIRSEKYLYELLPKGVSKGAALLRMAEMFGIRPERTIAAGDYYNDVSMLRAAGIGFAVANAVPEAKKAADYITVSNNEHAIAAIIGMLDRGELKL